MNDTISILQWNKKDYKEWLDVKHFFITLREDFLLLKMGSLYDRETHYSIDALDTIEMSDNIRHMVKQEFIFKNCQERLTQLPSSSPQMEANSKSSDENSHLYL